MPGTFRFERPTYAVSRIENKRRAPWTRLLLLSRLCGGEPALNLPKGLDWGCFKVARPT